MSAAQTPAQAETAVISTAVKKEINRWLKQFPPEQKRSGVLYALRLVQEENGGWLSSELLDAVATYLDLPKTAVYEVATFYKMYELQPVGRHKIAVCNSISCMLNGAEKVLEHLQYKLGVEIGGTSKDGLFLLKEVECLAACTGAPMMQVDDRQYYENLTSEKIDAVIDDIRQQEAKHAK